MLSAFADVSTYQLLLVAGVALFASVLGGVAGYGTGALMPLILVPMVGAENVVPIIALAGMLTNAGRTIAYWKHVEWHRALIVLAGAVPPCVITAYGYTMLTGKGAQLVIGTMLMLTVPLRYALRRRAIVLSDRGLLYGSIGYGTAVGGTVGAGVILLSLLMAAGLMGPAVIATDAMLSIAIGISRLMVFGFAGALTPKVIAYALLIGVIAFPGAFLARAFVKRMPLHVHTAILDAVVLIGGAVMVFGALAK
ncbi:MAG TPA: sulfite exporter TauE/SafE family protein [Xanthobacteraceae bacterium]